MLKVVFNRDGSIKTYELPTYVIKGSGGTISDSLKLEVAVEGLSLASGYLVNLRCKLPNGTTNTLALLNDLAELTLYGEKYTNGKYGYLTTAQTYYEGVVKASLEITTVSDTNNVLFTFPFNIVVNPSTYDPNDTDELISNAQFKNLELNYAQLSRNYFTVSLETNVINFITNNGIDGKIACFSIGSGIGSLQMIGCLQKTGGVLHFELESVGITPASRYAGFIQGQPVINATITFNDLLDETYTNVYETIKNKVSSWSATPNDTHYPSEKLVYDSLGTKLWSLYFKDSDNLEFNFVMTNEQKSKMQSLIDTTSETEGHEEILTCVDDFISSRGYGNAYFARIKLVWRAANSKWDIYTQATNATTSTWTSWEALEKTTVVWEEM